MSEDELKGMTIQVRSGGQYIIDPPEDIEESAPDPPKKKGDK